MAVVWDTTLRGSNTVTGSGLRSIDIPISSAVDPTNPTTSAYLIIVLAYHGDYGDGIIPTITDDGTKENAYFASNGYKMVGGGGALTNFNEIPFLTNPTFGVSIAPYLILHKLDIGDTVSVYLNTGTSVTPSMNWMSAKAYRVTGIDPVDPYIGAGGTGTGIGGSGAASPQTWGTTFSAPRYTIVGTCLEVLTGSPVASFVLNPDATVVPEIAGFDNASYGHIGVGFHDYGAGFSTTSRTISWTGGGNRTGWGAALGGFNAGSGLPYDLGFNLSGVSFRAFQNP